MSFTCSSAWKVRYVEYRQADSLEECILYCSRIRGELEEQVLVSRKTLGGEMQSAYEQTMQAVIQQLEEVGNQLRDVERL